MSEALTVTIADLAVRHVERVTSGMFSRDPRHEAARLTQRSVCAKDGAPWPCDTRVALDAVERERGRVRDRNTLIEGLIVGGESNIRVIEQQWTDLAEAQRLAYYWETVCRDEIWDTYREARRRRRAVRWAWKFRLMAQQCAIQRNAANVLWYEADEAARQWYADTMRAEAERDALAGQVAVLRALVDVLDEDDDEAENDRAFEQRAAEWHSAGLNTDDAVSSLVWNERENQRLRSKIDAIRAALAAPLPAESEDHRG